LNQGPERNDLEARR